MRKLPGTSFSKIGNPLVICLHHTILLGLLITLCWLPGTSVPKLDRDTRLRWERCSKLALWEDNISRDHDALRAGRQQLEYPSHPVCQRPLHRQRAWQRRLGLAGSGAWTPRPIRFQFTALAHYQCTNGNEQSK